VLVDQKVSKDPEAQKVIQNVLHLAKTSAQNISWPCTTAIQQRTSMYHLNPKTLHAVVGEPFLPNVQ